MGTLRDIFPNAQGPPLASKTREDLDTQGNRRVTDDPGWGQGAAGGALVTHQTALAVVCDWGFAGRGRGDRRRGQTPSSDVCTCRQLLVGKDPWT